MPRFCRGRNRFKDPVPHRAVDSILSRLSGTRQFFDSLCRRWSCYALTICSAAIIPRGYARVNRFSVFRRIGKDPEGIRGKSKRHLAMRCLSVECWRIPILPGRRQPSIVGTTELNFCVRNGNRWTLCVNHTNCVAHERLPMENRIRVSTAILLREPCSSSFRSISIGQLNALLRFHLRPI